MMTASPTHASVINTVLIISRDMEMTSVWETLFQQKNCFVFNETTPQTALQSAKLTSPALIILDLDLPRSARLELCQQLRATTEGTLLLLAPSHDSQNLLEYIDAGVDEHLVTPISPMGLLVKSMAWLVRQEWGIPA